MEYKKIAKKILFVADHSIDSVSGAVESTKIIMGKLKNIYNFILFTPGLAEWREIGIHHIHYSCYTSMKTMILHPLSFVAYYFHLLRLIRSNNICLIHTQEQICCFVIAFFRRLYLVDKNIILIHTERGLYEKYSNIIQKIFFFSLPYIDTFILTTEYNRNLWVSAIHKKNLSIKTQFRLIRNTAGAFFERYEAEKRKKDGDFLTVGFAGRFCSWKGWTLAEDLCNRFSMIPEIKVHIVMGCNTDSDLSSAHALFKRLDTQMGNRFVGDINLDIEQMSDFYYGLDIFILTSDPGTESFGRVLVEAMSRKVVVLGTDRNGATEVIGDRRNICVSADEFVRRVCELLVDKEQLNAERERCYRRVKEKYSLDSNIEAHMKMYAQYTKE